MKGINIHGNLLHPVYFTQAMSCNTCEEGIHYLCFKSGTQVRLYVYAYAYICWNSVPLSTCTIHIYGMNYSKNINLYNFEHLIYLYIYIFKKCL